MRQCEVGSNVSLEKHSLGPSPKALVGVADFYLRRIIGETDPVDRPANPGSCSRPCSRLWTKPHHAPIAGVDELKLRPSERSNPLHLRAAHFGLRPNNLGLRSNLIPHDFRLIADLLAQQITLEPRVRESSGRCRSSFRHNVGSSRHADCARQPSFGARGYPAQREIGAFNSLMQRHKIPVPVFATQSQRQYSQRDPVSDFVRVHAVLLAWYGFGRTARKNVNKTKLRALPGLRQPAPYTSASRLAAVSHFCRIIGPSGETLPAPSVSTMSPGCASAATPATASAVERAYVTLRFPAAAMRSARASAVTPSIGFSLAG